MAKRPTMPKSDPQVAALFEKLLPGDVRVTVRPMFGHKAAFVNGNMFAGTFGAAVFVRLDQHARAELLAVPGAKSFEPMKGRPMVEYVQLPASLLADQATTKAWVSRARDWALTLPPKGKRTRKAASKVKR